MTRSQPPTASRQPVSRVRSALKTVKRPTSAPEARSIVRTLSSFLSDRTVVRTSCPAFNNWRTTWLPTKPLPPVTRTALMVGFLLEPQGLHSVDFGRVARRHVARREAHDREKRGDAGKRRRAEPLDADE